MKLLYAKVYPCIWLLWRSQNTSNDAMLCFRYPVISMWAGRHNLKDSNHYLYLFNVGVIFPILSPFANLRTSLIGYSSEMISSGKPKGPESSHYRAYWLLSPSNRVRGAQSKKKISTWTMPTSKTCNSAQQSTLPPSRQVPLVATSKTVPCSHSLHHPYNGSP